MRITELSKLTGATTDQIRYLERKSYIDPSWIKLNRRKVRNYTNDDARVIMIFMKYFNEGFRYEAAYQKALDELQSPRLV